MSTDVPRFNLRGIEKLRDKLNTEVFLPLSGHVVNVDFLAQRLLAFLPSGITYDTVFESVRVLAGSRLTDNDGIVTAWRLAGNVNRLKQGYPVNAWTSQEFDEWVPVQVLRMQKTRNRYNKVGYDATLRVLAGTPCAMKIYTFWTQTALPIVAGKIGFSPSYGKYPFSGGAEFVNLQFLVRIEAERSQVQPRFFEVSCSNSMITRNRRDILKLRMRLDGHNCPLSFSHDCWQCAVGYERCTAGTHYRTYVQQPCMRCGKSDVLHDPEDTSTYCIKCAMAERMKVKS